MRNSTTENTGRLANVLIMLLLLTPDSVFALGQVEVVEAESTIVPAERYPSDGYFDAVSDRKSRAQIFDSNAPAAVASAAATNTDILLQYIYMFHFAFEYPELGIGYFHGTDIRW